MGDIRLWLPQETRKVFHPAAISSNANILAHGAGWAIARSAVNFILQCIHGNTAKYKMESLLN